MTGDGPPRSRDVCRDRFTHNAPILTDIIDDESGGSASTQPFAALPRRRVGVGAKAWVGQAPESRPNWESAPRQL
jgi:hypothetical protein